MFDIWARYGEDIAYEIIESCPTEEKAKEAVRWYSECTNNPPKDIYYVEDRMD